VLGGVRVMEVQSTVEAGQFEQAPVRGTESDPPHGGAARDAVPVHPLHHRHAPELQEHDLSAVDVQDLACTEVEDPTEQVAVCLRVREVDLTDEGHLVEHRRVVSWGHTRCKRRTTGAGYALGVCPLAVAGYAPRMDDGFAQLEQDHREIEEQFQILMRDQEDPVVRELCDQVSRHAILEETVLHPPLRRWVDGGDDLADQAQQELVTISTIVAQLTDSATPDQLGDVVGQLHHAVSAHFAFVESEIIAEMREIGVQPLDVATDGAAGQRRAG
jgi:hypothetical protein